MSNKILKLSKECMFRSKIEKIEDFQSSYFNDTYKKAFKVLNAIVESNSACDNSDSINYIDNDTNNIIAFIGDRGSGKTSTMKSFKEALKNENIKELSERYKISPKKRFECIDIIDPTLFSEKESLVEIVIASMFQKFKECREQKKLIERQKLVKLFEIVYKDLEAINISKCDKFKSSEDDLEKLMKLASVSTLRSNINKLVKAYLEFIVNDKDKRNYLVVSIDDLDMNLEVGEKMIEDIRKYLIQDNIIILLAVKFEQLEEVMEQKFIRGLQENYKFYKELSNKDEKLDGFSNEIDIKVRRYVDKLIPYNRRCMIQNIKLQDISINFDSDSFDGIKKIIESY